MDFIVDKFIPAYITEMLSKANDDNCLVLAYGYFDSKNFPYESVWSWLRAEKNRHILLVVGIHGKPGFNSYLAATQGDGTVPMESVADEDIQKLIENVKLVFRDCNWGCEALESPEEHQSCANIHVVIAEHFHAKLAMTAKIDSSVNFYKRWPSTWIPTSAIFGSSNMTYAAQHYNIEFDAYLTREDRVALESFGRSSSQLIKLAIALAGTDGSVSEKATLQVVDAISSLLADNETNSELAAKKKKSADYDKFRMQADGELE